MHAIAKGLGVEVCEYDKPDPKADLVVSWGARSRIPFQDAKERGVPYLVMELGYFGERHQWNSLTYNGLHGHGYWPQALSEPRPRPPMRPWRTGGSYVLLCGQVNGDVALTDMDPKVWYPKTVDLLRARFRMPVWFRGHPRWPWDYPENADRRFHGNPNAESGMSLEKNLDGAALAATYSSTCAVNSVLAGVPTLVESVGCPAWPVAGHGMHAVPTRPDREAWVHELSYRQWSEAEMAEGAMNAWLVAGYEEARARSEKGEYGAWPDLSRATY